MNEDDYFYIREIDLIEVPISVLIIQVHAYSDLDVDETIFNFVMECKDPIILEEYLLYKGLDVMESMRYTGLKELIIERLNNLIKGYIHVDSFSYEDELLMTPAKSFTVDKILCVNPLKVAVLLRDGTQRIGK